MRFDIAFFLCCCRSFLSSSGREEETFYDLLGVTKKASADELKRAYKKQSLQMHPDKLAQRGQAVTSADRDRFTRMRHAYEVLSDPRRRETYDAIGERGMKWVEEPLSVDPQELAHNFATSSVLDRSKIFGIFFGVYVAVFLLPVLVCLQADGQLGDSARWVAVLAPLWVWDVLILFYHTRVILMGPIKRPDHVPEEEWVDPLPMSRRVTAMVRFSCLVLFQVLLALRLDGYSTGMPWSVVFAPMFAWDGIALRRKVMLSNMVIVTHDEVELIVGKKLSDCSPVEREEIHRRYIVVPSKSGSIFDSANRLKDEAKMDVVRILARVLFTVLLVLNLDLGAEWSWWVVFLPLFGTAACISGSAFRAFSKTQSEAARKDPAMFGLDPTPNDEESPGATPYTKMGDEAGSNKQDNGGDTLTDEEKEELKARVAQSAYRAVGTCLSQCFVVIIICVLIGKLEGATYSSVVIISPFLAAGGAVLCCLACTIFCISEVDENAGMTEFDTAVDRAAAGYGAMDISGVGYNPPTTQQEDITRSDGGSATPAANGATTMPPPPPKSTWDPERGEVWENATVVQEEGDGAAQSANADMEEKGRQAAAANNDGGGDAHPTTIDTNPSGVSIPSVTSSQCDLD